MESFYPSSGSFCFPVSFLSEETFLLDHIIDGRVLYPFTGHMVLAWKTIAKLNGVDFLKTPVILEEIRVYSATIVTKPIRLDVIVTPGNGYFEILDGDQLAASGYIRIIDKDMPFYYKNVGEIQTSEVAERIELDTEDAYKEFLLRGYEYGQAFRGIYRACNSGERGMLYWTGNWVTFLDSLLQTALLAERADSLRLPTRVRYLRIDPIKHMEHIQEIDGIQVIELRNDIATNGCIAGGVECCDLTAHTVARRLQSAGQLYYEKIYFTKHFDKKAFDEFPQIREELNAYRDFLRSILANGLAKWEVNGCLKELINGALLSDAVRKFTRFMNPVSEAEHKRWLDDSQSPIATVFDEIFAIEIGDNSKDLVNKVAEKMQSMLKIFNVDRLWSAAIVHDRILKTIQDTCIENSTGHKCKACALEFNSTEQLKFCVDAVNSHPLLEMEWLCVGPKVDDMDESTLIQLGVKKVKAVLDEKQFVPAAEIRNCDLIILDKMLSRKKEVVQYLSRCKEMLRDDGFIILVETTSDYEIALAIQGLSAETISISDSGRIYGAYFTHDQLLKLFEECGFLLCNYQTDPSMMTTMYAIRKIPSQAREPIVIDVDDIEEFTWIEPLQKAIEERLNEPDYKTIWLTSTTVRNNGLLGLALCFKQAFNIANVILDNARQQYLVQVTFAYVTENISNWKNCCFSEENLKSNRFRTLIDMSVKKENRTGPAQIRMDDESVKQLMKLDLHANNYRDGVWGSMRHVVVKEDDMHLYKDVDHAFINTLIRGDVSSLTWFESPNQFFEDTRQKNSSLELCHFSGRLKDGTRLMGILPAQALATSVIVNREYAWAVPDNWSLADAATDRHFANSRNSDFELHIRHQTRGRGVDVVLNSLAQHMLQASIRCLAQNGRFLEIGKVDLSQNSPLGMAVFLKNITFHGILLDAVMDPSVGKKEDWQEVARLVQDGIKSGIVQPLSYTAFSSEKAEEAFRFMSSGKHIGKVLMEIRQEEPERVCVPSPIKVRAICRTLCHPNHVYLITGGLGGFGLELSQWLINRGAKKLVLTSRMGIRTGYQARCVHFWRRTGISVLVSTLNIAHLSDAHELMSQCKALGSIGGVFHLAMVLRDCLFENQNVQNFKDAAEAKYWGTLNLDAATRNACGKELRWFVAFSSITSGRGNAGQTNYGWSNCTMERIIEHRREDGFPGIAIQWGAIGDVGVILENMGDNNTVVGGTLPQRMPSCLAALDLFLSWNHPIVASYIKADIGTKKVGSSGNLWQTMAHILGVNDASQLNPDANLGDLGLDSLMGVEIKQALERDYDIVLSMKDIRTLTLNKLQQLVDSGGTASTVLQTTELELKKESEKEAEQNTVEQLERQMNQLFKMRVDVNDLEPMDLIVKCNKVEVGPPTFFVHSIEGIATPLKKVMSKCNFPAYCFQSTREVPQDSIEKVARKYIMEMKKIQPEGPYRIIGYSYGACIGFEMATMLQESDGANSVEKLILLDGSHLYMQTYRNVYRMAFGVTGDTLVNNPLFESEIMCAMTLRFANVDYKKFRVELLQQPGFKARVQKVVDTVMTTGLFKSADTIDFACCAMRSKFVMADKYKPERKFKGLVTLIRAEQGAAREEDVGFDYGISQVSDDNKVYIVEGDHDSFVQGKTSGKTVNIINDLIAETNKKIENV
ncbi:unnamed protein product [Onchocerca flexuosa]|uniref:Fatty acid synthase n=1 Tax=Onchocerca flexuosa TaxID=387005 RepID=A0A183HZM8_9BILA|nr:unnamed protein product [Onchocerca flexuosa]